MKNQIVKLTTVRVRCRGKVVQTFLRLPYFNGKPVIKQSQIDKLFWEFWGFTPQRGETISIG